VIDPAIPPILNAIIAPFSSANQPHSKILSISFELPVVGQNVKKQAQLCNKLRLGAVTLLAFCLDLCTNFVQPECLVCSVHCKYANTVQTNKLLVVGASPPPPPPPKKIKMISTIPVQQDLVFDSLGAHNLLGTVIQLFIESTVYNC
jgi:hypothetical protein